MPELRRAALYLRISQDRVGAGLGVQRQEEDLRALGERLGWDIRYVYQDNDTSAYSGKKRPGYLELLEAIRDGKIDLVGAWHTDRLHRSPKELETYIDACAIHGVSTHTCQAGYLDLATPGGRMSARQLGVFARYESEIKSERVKSAMQSIAAKGEYRGGGRPFGWTEGGVTEQPDEKKAVAEATEEIIKGGSLSAIARRWNHDGIRTTRGNRWRPGTVRNVLLRERNAGLILHRGKIIGQGEWDKLIEPEEWHAVRRILTDPTRQTTPGPEPKHLGSQRYRCGATLPDGTECGGFMKVVRGGAARANKSGVRQQRAQAYRCNREDKQGVFHVILKREPVDAYVIDQLLKGMIEQGATTSEPTKKVDQEDVSEIDAAQEALGRELAAGRLPAAVWETLNAQLAERCKEIEEQQADEVSARTVSAYLGEFERDPRGTWDKMTLAQQRTVLDTYVTVTILPAASRSRWGSDDIASRVRLDWDWSIPAE